MTYLAYVVNPPFPKIGEQYVLNGFGGFGMVAPANLSIPSGSGGLTPAQQKVCDALKTGAAKYPNVLTGCGLCPTCPPPTECPECPMPVDCDCGPSCADQGLITPEDCAASKAEAVAAATGIRWWWLLVAGGAGLAAGYGLAKMK